MEDAQKKSRRGKMPGSPILGSKGFTKNAGGKLGEYTGGLTPGIVKPVAGLPERRVAPTIFRGYNSDGRKGK